MARKKEFDREEVLDRAMVLFWEKGYESTSLRDLVDRMGIGRASLYDTFGSKNELFAEAMSRYCEMSETEILAPLRTLGPAKKVLAEFFRRLVDGHAAGRPACLAVKSALTTSREDAPTAARVDYFFHAVEEAFYDLLLRARADGQLKPGRNLRALARFYTAGMQGLSVMASLHRDRKVLNDVVRNLVAAAE